MARALMDGSGNSIQDTPSNWSSASNKPMPEIAAERLIMALASVLRDEINILRALGLIGLTARSVDDIVNAIKAKLT